MKKNESNIENNTAKELVSETCSLEKELSLHET